MLVSAGAAAPHCNALVDSRATSLSSTAVTIIVTLSLPSSSCGTVTSRLLQHICGGAVATAYHQRPTPTAHHEPPDRTHPHGWRTKLFSRTRDSRYASSFGGGRNLVDCRSGMVSVGSLITVGTDSKPFREPRVADRDSVMLVSTGGNRAKDVDQSGI